MKQDTEFQPREAILGRKIQIVEHRRQNMNQRAQLAAEMVARWGAISAAPDGEDSAGRAKARLQTPAEIVKRAIDCADLLWTAFEQRGWIVEVESLDVLEAKLDEDRKTKLGR